MTAPPEVDVRCEVAKVYMYRFGAIPLALGGVCRCWCLAGKLMLTFESCGAGSVATTDGGLAGVVAMVMNGFVDGAIGAKDLRVNVSIVEGGKMLFARLVLR